MLLRTIEGHFHIQEFTFWITILELILESLPMIANIKYEMYEIAYIIFTGLNPDPELHTTYLNIEPMTGNK